MRETHRIRVPILLIAALCLSDPPDASERVARASATLGRGEQAEMIAAHNRWRASVGVTPLRWSPALARRAQAWATSLASDDCDMRHSRAADVGENLFFASAWQSKGRRQVQVVSPRTVVDTWAREAADYSHARNRCAPGRVCGHYTQVVWSGTREVGCGKAVCADKGQIWVCNYQPPGNLAGHRPY